MHGSLRVVVAGAAVLLGCAQAQAAELRDVRLWSGPDATRVVLDLDAEAAYKVFTLANPDRIVIDLDGARRAESLHLGPALSGMVRNIRTGPRDGGLRVVLDLNAPAAPQAFPLQAAGDYGYRLILDLSAPGAAPAPADAPAQQTAAAAPAPISVPASATESPPKSEPATVPAAASGRRLELIA